MLICYLSMTQYITAHVQKKTTRSYHDHDINAKHKTRSLIFALLQCSLD